MGFLSRKKKPQPVVEDTHPLEEELRGMEEAVPEAQYREDQLDGTPLDGGIPGREALPFTAVRARVPGFCDANRQAV